jgi:adenylate kinase family enzyme
MQLMERRQPVRIHILGASGAGTTTLGRALAQACAVPFYDSDDFYWLPGDPPYTDKRPVPERKRLLRLQLEQSERWVLSGSLVNWSDEVEHLFTHIVFLSLPQEIRLQRLKAREVERHGHRVRPGGDMYGQSQDFLAYAALYESGRMDVRSRALHMHWLQRQTCPILELDTREPVELLVEKTKQWKDEAMAGNGSGCGPEMR